MESTMPIDPFKDMAPNEDEMKILVELRGCYQKLHDLIINKCKDCNDRSRGLEELQDSSIHITRVVLHPDSYWNNPQE